MNIMKKNFKILISLLIVIYCHIFAFDEIKATESTIVRSGNYEYQILSEDDKTASLRKVHNYGEEVVLPSSIDGYKIVCIGSNEGGKRIDLPTNEVIFDYSNVNIFSEIDTIIKKLVIPEGITVICPNAFRELKSLEYLQLPDSMSRMNENNFMNAVNLKQVNFPEGMDIWDMCFYNSVIDKLIVKGMVNAYAEDFGGMYGVVNELIVKKGNKEDGVIDLTGVNVNDMVIKSGVKQLYIYGGNYKNIEFENHKTVFKYNQECTTIGKVKANVSKVKERKKSKRYEYSWTPMKVYMSYWTLEESGEKNMKSEIKYNVKVKNKGKKYKDYKSTKKCKVTLKSKSKVRVEVEYTPN